MEAVRVVDLDTTAAAAVAALAAIGMQSGATVVGLSAVRRCADPALLFIASGLATGTTAELCRLASRNRALVFRLADLGVLTSRFGRRDVLVVAIRRGDLAAGMEAKLPPP